MPPGLDPVNVVAGVIRGQVPTLPLQVCLKLAFDVIEALKDVNNVTNFQSVAMAPQMGGMGATQ